MRKTVFISEADESTWAEIEASASEFSEEIRKKTGMKTRVGVGAYLCILWRERKLKK